MTDREMIEQMKNDICNACKPRVAKCKCNFPCSMCGIVATELVEKYQPKIPEDSVVLTKEEYEELFKDGFGIMTSHIGDLEINPEGMRKAVDEIARLIRVQNELQVINAKYYNEAKDLRRNMRILRQASHSIEEVNYKIEQAKKETVREILDRVDYESGGQTKQITDLLRKKYGIEIKE